MQSAVQAVGPGTRIGFLQGRRLAALTFCRLLALALCVSAFAGCHGKSTSGDTMPIHTTITPQPIRVGEATITITGIVDGLGEPLAGAHVQIEGDMAHPGMAPIFSDARETSPGTYQAHLNFTMPGDWVVLEHIRLANGTKIERQIDVKGVRAR
jgi:hypothetical protein